MIANDRLRPKQEPAGAGGSRGERCVFSRKCIATHTPPRAKLAAEASERFSMPRVTAALRAASLFAVSFGCACALGLFRLEPAVAQSPGNSVTYLDQAWPQADRDWYYHFSQGAAVISYDIFLNLELAGSQELFRSDTNSERYGLITDAANPQNNPDGLPIGLEQDCDCRPTTMEGRGNRRIRRPELRGLPRRAAELQRQADSHRGRRREHVRYDGVCICP